LTVATLVCTPCLFQRENVERRALLGRKHPELDLPIPVGAELRYVKDRNAAKVLKAMR
jgi:hypothetical protein